MFDLFEDVQEIAQKEYEAKFLAHAYVQAKNKRKELYDMKAITKTEFYLFENLIEAFKNELTIDDFKNRLDKRSEFEKLGREYERFKKKHEVKYGAELTEKLDKQEKEIKKLTRQLEYINDVFEEIEIEKPVELIKKFRQLENENKPSEVEIITEIDPTIEARANEFQKIVAQLGTENVFECIDELKRKANIPHELSMEDESFIIDGRYLFQDLVYVLVSENVNLQNDIILHSVIDYLMKYEEDFPEQLEEAEFFAED